MSQSFAASGKQTGFKTPQKSAKGPDASFKQTSTFRQSTGNLAARFSDTANGTGKSSSELERIESEYIKNLQQQVYFLELEANYLREEARKATELQPQMSAEAKRMVAKLAEMQGELDATRTDVKRKTSELEIANVEKERLNGRLKAGEDSHQREKRLLLDEITQLKKEKELLDRSLVNKDAEIIDVHKQLEMTSSACRTADNKIRLLESQLSQKTEQTRLLQQTIDDKRSELLKAESKLRETEEKYYSSAATISDKVKDDLREEIRLLKQKLKETELNAGQDRYLRTRMSDDSAHLVKENAQLSQQVLELQKQLDRERSMRESTDTRRSQNISELVALKDHENQLRLELEQTKDQLRLEQEKVHHVMEQVSHLEQVNTGHQLSLTTARSRLAEISAMQQTATTETEQLRRANDLLTRQLADLQQQIDEKQSIIEELQHRLHQLEPLHELQSTIDSQKWEEFSRLATSMKTLALRAQQTHSPSNHSTAPAGRTTSSTSLDYS